MALSGKLSCLFFFSRWIVASRTGFGCRVSCISMAQLPFVSALVMLGRSQKTRPFSERREGQ